MNVPIERLTEISREVIREMRPDVELMAVLPTDGGSERIELLININGCHKEPCRLLISLTRTDSEEFEEELRESLREGLRGHADS